MDIIRKSYVFILVTKDLKEKFEENWLPNYPLTQLD